MVRALLCTVFVLAFLVDTAPRAVELDLTPARIQAALAVARGPESARAAFHKPYVFAGNNPTVDSIEIITEYRRIVKIAEAKIADGNPLFAANPVAVQDAIKSFRNRVSVVAHLRFHPQNAYVVAPPVEVMLFDEFTPLPRLDLLTDTQFGFASAPKQRVPVFGATGEAVYDASVVAQKYRTIVVRLEDKDVTRVTTDFGRLQ